MGYLFENMEKMDIQLERRQRKEAQEEARKAQEELQKFQAEAQKKLQKVQIQTYIIALQDFSCSYEEALQKIQEKFSLDEKAARQQLDLYW